MPTSPINFKRPYKRLGPHGSHTCVPCTLERFETSLNAPKKLKTGLIAQTAGNTRFRDQKNLNNFYVNLMESTRKNNGFLSICLAMKRDALLHKDTRIILSIFSPIVSAFCLDILVSCCLDASHA